ncbi:MAG: type II secretion system protein [Acidobacteriota bacterium]
MGQDHVGRSGSLHAGFTLVELIIVVATVGIIAAVAVPNLLNALDKSRQKATMNDLRTIATAIESYAVDSSAYPVSITSWSALKPLVDPYFIKDAPGSDGWSNSWEVATGATGRDYSMISLGKDGASGARGGGKTTDFDCDIIFRTGQFFQWPEGTQT